MQIIDLRPDDRRYIEETATLLRLAFPQAWPDQDSARAEVHASFASGHKSRIALDEHDSVAGWIGAIEEYSGNAWELHPLVVRHDLRGQGIGRALVADLEELLCDVGASTLFLGTDDEFGQTSLSGVDLYPNVYAHIAAIRNLDRHPYEFYQRQGFVITGIIPDANGPGKPDILMAKQLRPRTREQDMHPAPERA